MLLITEEIGRYNGFWDRLAPPLGLWIASFKDEIKI